MTTHRTLPLGSLLLLLSACAEPRDSAFGPPSAMPDGDGGTDSGDGSSGEPSDSADEEPKLDLGDTGSVEEPTNECASITQTTTIEERPSDIIVVADDDTDRDFIQSNITNLLPGMETEGVLDAHVVLVAAGDPPPSGDDEFDCGAWNCRGASTFGSFLVVDQPVGADSLLTDLLAGADAWTPSLRAESWKHIWVMTTRTSDPSLGNDAFLEQIMAEVEADTGFTVHATILGDAISDGSGDPDGYAGLTDATDGVYSQGDYNLFDFQTPMIERINGTALACEYDIPAPPDGMIFARDKVNVIYDDGTGPDPIGHVEAATDCLGVGEGWYYDDALTPTKILMCPASCERFEVLTNATIDIEFGCDTIPAG